MSSTASWRSYGSSATLSNTGRSRSAVRLGRLGRRASRGAPGAHGQRPAWQPGFEDEETTVAGCVTLYGVYDFVDADKIANANLSPILERYVFGQAGAEGSPPPHRS